jgi:phosphoserine phosphatase RsbU/P
LSYESTVPDRLERVSVLANAGHLPPYRAGEELPSVSALPLGIGGSEDGWYEEISFDLQPADTLTFLSDGVVEARSLSGELFGFDRAREISDRSAEEIARAAQDFGQEDDITVLTLTFAPAEVLLA